MKTKKEMLDYIEHRIEQNCNPLTTEFKQGLYRAYWDMKHFISQCTKEKCFCINNPNTPTIAGERKNKTGGRPNGK